MLPLLFSLQFADVLLKSFNLLIFMIKRYLIKVNKVDDNTTYYRLCQIYMEHKQDHSLIWATCYHVHYETKTKDFVTFSQTIACYIFIATIENFMSPSYKFSATCAPIKQFITLKFFSKLH